MANAWITHLKNVHKGLPKGTSLKHAMKMAKKTYKKVVSSGNPKKHRRSHKKHRRSHKKRGGEGEGEGEEVEKLPV